jgi:ribosomal subunit interface protein
MKIDINSQHFELNEDIKKYVTRKINKLERQVPRKARQSTHAIVVLTENAKKKTDRFGCEVRIHLPNQEIVVEEATINMFAAVDIVEARLKNQLSKYHAKHSEHRNNRKSVLRKIRDLTDRDFWGGQN